MADDPSLFFEREPGPSWERPNWPIEQLDELNLGLDPTQATIEKVRQAVADRAAATGASPDEVRRAADDSIRAMMLIRTYRVRGHLAADLDPLHLTHRHVPADLTPEYHGFGPGDLDRPIYIAGTLGFDTATGREEVFRALRGVSAGIRTASRLCSVTTSSPSLTSSVPSMTK